MAHLVLEQGPFVHPAEARLAAGLGVAFVSRRSVALELAHGLLVEPDIPELRFRHQLSIVTRTEAHPPAAVTAFTVLISKHANGECARA